MLIVWNVSPSAKWTPGRESIGCQWEGLENRMRLQPCLQQASSHKLNSQLLSVFSFNIASVFKYWKHVSVDSMWPTGYVWDSPRLWVLEIVMVRIGEENLRKWWIQPPSSQLQGTTSELSPTRKNSYLLIVIFFITNWVHIIIFETLIVMHIM